MIFVLALRNLFRNGHNRLLLFLLGVLTSLFYIGNSLLLQSDQGLRESYIDNLTAHLMVQRFSDVSMNIFSANMAVLDDYFSPQPLLSYDELWKFLEEREEVALMSPLLSAGVIAEVGGIREGISLLGVEGKEYFELLPGIRLERGRFLSSSEKGIMLNKEQFEELGRRLPAPLEIGDEILLTAFSQDNFRIRGVPLVGVFSYENSPSELSRVVLGDSHTTRDLIGVLSTAGERVDQDLDFVESLDDLFEEGEEDWEGDFGSFSLEDIQLSQEEEPLEDLVGGDWYYILIRLKEGYSPPKVVAALNEELPLWEAMVVDWRSAAGTAALTVNIVRILFNIGVLLLCLGGGKGIFKILM